MPKQGEQARRQLLHELSNPKYAWCRVTRVIFCGDSGFYYGFAKELPPREGRTLYFQKPQKGRTAIWLGPWELKDHPPNRPPAKGHLLFGEWGRDRRGLRFNWYVSALDFSRFRRCLEQRNMIFVRRPTSTVATAMLNAVLYNVTGPLSELELKQLAHVCGLPLDYFLA